MIQQFFRQILEALEFVHSLQLTHTDLKPENILLEDEELKLDKGSKNPLYVPVSSAIRVIDFGGATK